MCKENAMNIKFANIMMASFVMLVCSLKSAPVPVDAVYCDPGYESATTTNRQTITHIAFGGDAYEVTGATCTECVGGEPAGTTNDIPASRTDALSGSVITHAVVGITGAAKFDLGVTVASDDIGIVLGEIGSTAQTAGDPINVYPLTNGVRVGSWVRSIVATDYGMFAENQFDSFRNVTFRQTLRPFLTAFRHSDFTNDTGTLVFDGIEINDNNGYDPNLLMTVNDPLQIESNKLPVTAMTFSPGFDENPELDGQVLTSITTAEGYFATLSEIKGLTCVSAGGSKFAADNEGVPDSTTNALSGLKFTQGSANIGVGDWVLDAPVDSSDPDLRFFFGEISISTSVNPDPVTITLLSEGEVIPARSLEILSGDYGNPSPVWDNTYYSTFVGTLVSFSLRDFMINPFDDQITNVTGFRVTSSVADPIIFGTYRIPPPGTMILVH